MNYIGRATRYLAVGAILVLFANSSSHISAQNRRKPQLSARQIARQTFPSVVVLIAEDESGDQYLGSGFFVYDDVVATNYHVTEGATKIVARRVGQRRVYQVSILGTDAESDLTLLKVQGAIARPLPLARGSRIAVGDVVYVASNPEGLEGTFSQGIVSALRGSKYIQITAPISHGSSGGPVLNIRGEVIGVAVGTLEQGQNLNFAIPVGELMSLITRSRDHQMGTVSRSTERTEKEASDYIDEGLKLSLQERYDEAVEAFKSALRLKPDDTSAMFGLASAYTLLHRYENAIELYSDLIQADVKDESRAFLGLASAYEGIHKYQEAIDLYRDLIRTHPQEPEAYEQLGYWLLGLRLKRYDEAVEILKRGISTIPKSFSLYQELAGLLQIQNRMPEAEAILKTAIQQSDSPAFAYYLLGDHYCNSLKRCAESIVFYRQAIKLANESQRGLFHYFLGEAYLKAGDRPSAIREYRLLKSVDAVSAERLFNEIYK